MDGLESGQSEEPAKIVEVKAVQEYSIEFKPQENRRTSLFAMNFFC